MTLQGPRQPSLSEDLNASMDTDPSNSTTGVMPPQETALVGRASEISAVGLYTFVFLLLPRDLIEGHEQNVSSRADPFLLEHEAAKERRRRRTAHESEAKRQKARFSHCLIASYQLKSY